MKRDEIPDSYSEILKIQRMRGDALNKVICKFFDQTGEPFDRPTAYFEADAYVAFRMDRCLAQNSRVWADLAPLLKRKVVGRHRQAVHSDDLSVVYARRIDTYRQCWDACVVSKTYPAISCLQMLRMFILGAAKRGRIDSHAPLDLTEGFVAEVEATPVLADVDLRIVGKVDWMLAHIMRLSDNLASVPGWEVTLAAIRGSSEADQRLGYGHVPSDQDRSRPAMDATGNPQPQANTQSRRKRWWWRFWA
ncbi:MAG: hypothetical protein KF869_10670 [Phycisphaeraceae bacterium]|nr:hypothetical protein [Phycisphaeraceae bacterium]